MEITKKQRLIFYPAPFKIFLLIKDNDYASTISKKADITYSHCEKLIKLFESFKLLKKNKEGRIKRVFLTQKGKDFQDIIRKILELLE